jgi:rubrerythrin
VDVIGSRKGVCDVDIFEYALAREKDSETYYRALASRSEAPGMKAVFTLLAEAEVRHQGILAKMKAKADVKLTEDPFLRDVKGLFSGLRDRGETPDAGSAQADLYRKAQSFEKESWDMYQKAAENAPSESARALLHRLAAQEKVHYQILSTLVELVSRPDPGHWLENAEWYHLDQY